MAVKKIKIALDLDGIIVDKPPLIPKKLLEFLFRGHIGNQLHYRFPRSKIEQFIRKISHFYLFRPPITKNIELLRQIAKSGKFELYIVSGRYSFLEKETWLWLEKRGIRPFFKEVFINLNDDQPHLFKEKILRQIKPDIFVDDDLPLVKYLRKRLASGKIFYYSCGQKTSGAIDSLDEIR